MKASNISGSTSVRGRQSEDFYATPFAATREILKHEQLRGSILEPACGQGHIAKVVRDFYPDSELVATDLVQREDKFGLGIRGGVDFLAHDFGRTFGNIITNPPFTLAQQFAEKALRIAENKVILFEKVQWLEGMSRYEFFKNSPLATVYVFSNRVSPMIGGNEVNEQGKKWASCMCFCWFVFDKAFSESSPRIKWLNTDSQGVLAI